MKNEHDYLYSLPVEKEEILPPVETKIQLLPFNNLSWDNFERLTLRYIESFGKLEHSQLYGKQGQNQEGIDLFVRHGTDHLYTVYQCKRYKDYNISNLKNAVSTFLNGKWVDKTKNFYICTACEMNERKLSDEIENQAKILKQKNINLFILDQVKLSAELKKHPKIVYDFFGKPWAQLFCGDEAIKNYTKRLSTNDFALYKNKLGKFYSTLFETHEGSISNLSGQNTCPKFESRYIVPDIVSNISIENYFQSDEKSHSSLNNMQKDTLSVNLIERIDRDYNLEKINPTPYQNDSNIENKLSSLDWVAKEKNTIIIGGPGSGKSALLRYIVLGLLDQIDISKSSLQKNRSKLIPVWLPFGFWTNHMEANPNASLTECMMAWFKGMNHDDLWPLMKHAIDDDRLLLVVDGLDEWSSKQTALICLNKLTVFIKENDISSILSSRPSGIERLNMNTNNWALGHLTGLSKEQQEKLIKICVKYRLENQQNTDKAVLHHETKKICREFISEISRSKDLLDLSSIPLLIYMLIHLKTKNISLPHSKFSVYKELISDLVKVQPQRRKIAAQMTTSKNIFSETELISILSKLAYEIQVNHPHGNVLIEDTKIYINNYLSDDSKEFGLNKRDASRQTDEFVDISETEIGILVKKSTDEIGFFHRTLQEFLAAQYISTESTDIQNDLISKYIFNPQWIDVFLGLFSQLQKNHDIENLVEYIKALRCNEHEEMLKELFLAQIAFGDNKCSALTAKKISKATFDLIEHSHHLPHKNQLLKIIIGGYNSSKLHDDILKKLKSWIPEGDTWFNYFFEQVDQHWPADQITKDILFLGISQKNMSSKKTAADVICSKFSSDQETLSYLMKLIKNTLDLETRFVASYTIFKGWSDSREAKTLYNNFKTSNSKVAHLLRIYYESKNRIANDLNRKFLIENSSFDTELSYYWHDIILECLELCYLNEKLKEICFSRVFDNNHAIELNLDIAIKILTSHFHNDTNFITNFTTNIDKNISIFFLPHNVNIDFIGKMILKSDAIYNLIENIIIKNDVSSSRLFHLFKSDKMKKFLLEELKKENSFIHWPVDALLRNWGIDDTSIKKAILKITDRNDHISSVIAHLYPIIFEDNTVCYKKLIGLLENENSKHFKYERITSGLLRVVKEENREHAFNALNKALAKYNLIGDYKYLPLHFGIDNLDAEIETMALNSLDDTNRDISLVAKLFHNRDDLRKILINKINVLCPSLRATISILLSEINTDLDVYNLLKNYTIEIEPSIKTQSAIGLYSSPLIVDDSEIIFEKLKSEIFHIGINNESIRETAFCSFVATRLLHKAKELEDPFPYSKNKKLNIPVFYPVNNNETYYNYLAKEWDYINSEFPSFIDELDDNQLNLFFSNIGPHVDSNELLKSKFKDYLYEKTYDYDDRILISASRVIPGEDILLIMCFNKLGIYNEKTNNKFNYHNKDNLLALHILRQQFYENNNAKKFLIDSYENNNNDLQFILAASIAIGFSDAPFISEINKKIKNDDKWLPLHFYYLSIENNNKNAINSIIRTINHLKTTPSTYSKYFCSIVSTLINEKKSLERELLVSIKSEDSIQIKLPLLTLYIQSKGINTISKDIVMDLYKKQKRKTVPDIVFNISDGYYSIATDVLINLLYNYE